MPSACSVSKAYSISLRVASMSSIDSVANRPKRPLWSRIISAAKSLQVRAMAEAAAGSRPIQVPGVDAIDSTPVVMPFLSRSSTAFGTDQAPWPGECGRLPLSPPAEPHFLVGRRIEVMVRVDHLRGGALGAQWAARQDARGR